MQSDTFVKTSSILQSQKYPKGNKFLEAHFFPNWKNFSPFCYTENLSKNEKFDEKTFEQFFDEDLR